MKAMAYNYQPYRASGNVIDYKNKQDTATRNYNNYANTNYSAGAGGLSNEVKTAQDRLNALYRNNNLSQQFKYSKQGDYNKALNAISNRKAFEYDLSNDMLFQQAKEQYQQMGKTAMADTVGQASAMTGGYGNSYATTAGAQAYNNFLQELNNSIGDYYSMALSTYNNETDRLNGVYNALATDKANEANEWSNNWNVYNQLYSQYYNQYSDMLNKDISAWQQKGSNLYNAANLATSQYGTASSNDINIWNSQEQLRAEQAQQYETERANRATEAYHNAALAETVRANKANEAYNKAKAEQEQRNNTVTPTATQRAKSLVADINQALLQRTKATPNPTPKNTKTKDQVIENMVQREMNNHNLDAGEAAWIYQTFNL